MILLSNDIWRPLPGFEGFYEISQHGELHSLDRAITDKNGVVYNRKGTYFKPSLDSKGYQQTQLHKDGAYVPAKIHKLVVLAFPDICGVWYEGCQIDHLNGCRIDNRALNLRVTDALGNTSNPITKKRHYENTRCLKRKYSGKGNPMYGKPASNRRRVVMCDLQGNSIKTFDSIQEATNHTGIRHISSCCSGNRKTAGGYIWKYCSD